MAEEKKAKSRSSSIDIVKGLGMLLVVWAHILVRGPINHFIYTFHMPLFFIVSGMMFDPARYTKFGPFLKKKILTLIVPYIIYSFLTWVEWVLLSYITKAKVGNFIPSLLQTVIAQGSGGFFLHNAPLWFVTCLFAVEIIYYFISRIPGRIIRLGLCVLITALGYCMIELFSFYRFDLLPWSLEVAFAVMIFYGAGSLWGHGLLSYIKNLTGKSRVYLLLAIIGLGIIVGLCTGINGGISFGSDSLGSYPLLTYSGAFSGSLLMLLISSELTRKSFASGLINRVLGYIKWVGKHSFHFMVFHFPIQVLAAAVVARVFRVTSEVLGVSVFYSGIAFIITMCATTITTLIAQKAESSLKGAWRKRVSARPTSEHRS